MPANRKFFIHNTPVFVTSRVESGLPLPPTKIINFLIWGILARAKALHRVKICHFVFMANHFHMLLVVEDPEDIPKFVGYVKSELAHAINRLLGRRQRTVWVKGYDSPTILTADDVIKYIAYIYSNPTKANLVESIGNYPGISSWKMYVSGQLTKEHKHIFRDEIPKLPSAALSVTEQHQIAFRLSRAKGSIEVFELEPNAWLQCFSEEGDPKERILELVAHEESLREGGVVGATALRRQSMLKEYTPSKFSNKMICLCSEIELRKSFINHFKALCEEARQIYERWKTGEIHLKMPPGLFAPRMPPQENLLLCPT